MSAQDAPFAAVLLAGGQSSRMGRDKAWLDWQGEPFWQIQWNKLAALELSPLLLSCRQEQQIHPTDGEVLFDPPDNAGPLPVILRCLEKVGKPLLVLAVDMPQITVSFLRSMLQQERPNDSGLVFSSSKGYEPLCAIYTPAVLPLLKQAVAENNLRLQSFIGSAISAGLFIKKPLSSEDQSLFLNLNLPTDYACSQPPHLK